MPIRADQRHLYPLDWDEQAAKLKAAAGWRCACMGECGRDHGGRCVEVHNTPASWRRQLDLVPGRAPRVVLSVGHGDHHPENSAPENLHVFCQDCHLRHDRLEHALRRWRTWEARRKARVLAERQAVAQLELLTAPAPAPGDPAALAALERARHELYRREKQGQLRFRFGWGRKK